MRERQSSAIMQHQVALLMSGSVIDFVIQFCLEGGVSPRTAKIQTTTQGYTTFNKRKMRQRKRKRSKPPINDSNTFARRGDNIERRYRPHGSARINHLTRCLTCSSPPRIPSGVVNRSMPSTLPTAGRRTCQMSASILQLDDCDSKLTWWRRWRRRRRRRWWWWWWTFSDIIVIMKVVGSRGLLITAVTIATDVVQNPSCHPIRLPLDCS